MAPYFDRVKSFADVPVTEAGVDTASFLQASSDLADLFDLFGSAAFSPVQSDIRGNVAKVRARYESHKAQSETLEQLVENEKGEKKRVATEGLMWLLRGLSFTCKGLQAAQADPNVELSKAFTTGYEATLKKFHNFVVKGIFAVAMKACPYRATFFDKLASDPDGGASTPKERVHEQLESWLAALEKIVTRMEDFYEKGEHNKGF